MKNSTSSKTDSKTQKTHKKQRIVRSLITIFSILAFFGVLYLIMYFTGIIEKLDTPEEIKEIILKGGTLSYLIFIVIQFLQVTIIPIPAMITTIAGSLVFGPWITLVLSLIAVIAGSIFAFWLGRKFGKKLIYWIAGKEDGMKWIRKLTNGKYLFFLMMLFPGFPDDILCLVAGATNMTYKFFIITNLIARPLVFAGIVFFGGGHIIPFTGWGITVWIVLVIVMAILFYLSIRYQKQIESYLVKTSNKMDTKSKN